MLWKLWCFALQSMGHTNHIFPHVACVGTCNTNVQFSGDGGQGMVVPLTGVLQLVSFLKH